MPRTTSKLCHDFCEQKYAPLVWLLVHIGVSTNMIIREIEKEDITKLAELYVSVFSSAPWNEEWKIEWAVDRLNTICCSPGFYGLTVENQETIIAAAVGRSIPFKGRSEFELLEFYVSPTSQSKGIGKKLLSKLEIGLRDRGCKICTLLTARGTDAEQFYLRHDYQINEKLVFMSSKLKC